MELILAATATPLVLILLSTGIGLLFNFRNLNSHGNLALKSLYGFTWIIVLGYLFTLSQPLVGLLPEIIILLSIVGWVLNIEHLGKLRDSARPLFVFGISYLIAAMPLFLYGKVTWAGWVQLDDTSTFLAMTSHLFEKGQETISPVQSTFDRTIDVNFSQNYPVGALIPLGIIGNILNQDFAWIFFPTLCSISALFSSSLYCYLRQRTKIDTRAAFASILSSQAATYYAYALWGGIKEVILPPLIFFAGVVCTKLFEGFEKSRNNFIGIYAYVLISITSLYAVGGKTALGFFFLPLLLLFILYFYKNYQSQNKKRYYLLFILVGSISVVSSRKLVEFLNDKVIVRIPDSGNLGRPLNFFQSFGIWPSGDFRSDLVFQPFSHFLVGTAATLSIIGLIFFLRNQLSLVSVLGISTLGIVAYSSIFSGVWLTGKAMAVASPFLLLAAVLTAFQIGEGRQRLLEVGFSKILVAFLAIGIFSSNYMASAHAWMAPSEKVQELSRIGRIFENQGPTLMTDYSPFGARYFLRKLGAESASELRVNLIPTRDGKEVPKGFSADIDLFDNSEIRKYPLLVLKSTAVGSRPLFNYDIVFKGNYYDVWKLNLDKDFSIRSLPIGNNYQAGAAPDCQEIQEFTSGYQGDIYFAERTPIYYLDLSKGFVEGMPMVDQGNFGAVITKDNWGVKQILRVDKPGNYKFFVGGSVPGKIEVWVNLERIYSGGSLFEGNKFLSNYLFDADLNEGNNLIQIRYSRPFWSPGAFVETSLGPIAITKSTSADVPVGIIDSKEVLTLCQKNIDWIATINR